MKVTVCELSDNELDFITEWKNLKIHIEQNKTELLLLPEMPFCKWTASEKEVNEAAKIESVEKHAKWMTEVEQLKVKYVVYSKPVIAGDKFFNNAYVYGKHIGHRKLHTKSLFPEEPHFWEETWYDTENVVKFEALDLGDIKIGALVCTEMWFTQYAREYGKQDVDILVCPRATGLGSVIPWIRLGQSLSIISGAYCLSSNRSGQGDHNFQWGGKGWITEPMDGNLLRITSGNEKFVTREIDINKSRKAKKDYPLYVKDQS